MFDIWWGHILLTRVALIVSIAVFLPVQLLLCFKVKSRIFRLLPVIILSALTAVLVICGLVYQGWDGLGYILIAVFTGCMLFMCGVGWGIWAIIHKHKAK
ncbi:MAG: hypothetical protein IJE27_00495 [Anaerotignum sp.]|nr:hypothetical protein [Anaerotignum sp.]